MNYPEIIPYPNPVLRTKCREVESFGDHLKEVAVRLADAMAAYHGAGVAAPQIGSDLRVIVVSKQNGSGFVLANPVITSASDEKTRLPEGCLSFPLGGLNAPVERSARVTVSYRDLVGEGKTVEAEGALARSLQHEIDHLDGVLFVDRVGASKKALLRKQLAELEQAYRVHDLGEKPPPPKKRRRARPRMRGKKPWAR
jgi:peptide deformylase